MDIAHTKKLRLSSERREKNRLEDDSEDSESEGSQISRKSGHQKSQTRTHSTTKSTISSQSSFSFVRQRGSERTTQHSDSLGRIDQTPLPSKKTQYFDYSVIGAVKGLPHLLVSNLWCVMLVLATVAVFSVFIRANLEDENGSRNGNPQVTGIGWLRGQEQLKQSLIRLKAKYPSQKAWIQIYSAISSTMTQEIPKQPSAIVFLTPPVVGIEAFTSCLSREIAKNTHSVFYNITGLQHTQRIREISADYFQKMNTITEIHDDLKTYLNNGKVLIVKDIEKINRQDHLFVFHAFCDNSAAPDKRATFIFIIPVPQKIYNQYEWKEHEGAEISQEILSSAWTSVSPDKRPALIARVAPNIVMIQPMRGDKCQD